MKKKNQRIAPAAFSVFSSSVPQTFLPQVSHRNEYVVGTFSTTDVRHSLHLPPWLDLFIRRKVSKIAVRFRIWCVGNLTLTFLLLKILRLIFWLCIPRVLRMGRGTPQMPSRWILHKRCASQRRSVQNGPFRLPLHPPHEARGRMEM